MQSFSSTLSPRSWVARLKLRTRATSLNPVGTFPAHDDDERKHLFTSFLRQTFSLVPRPHLIHGNQFTFTLATTAWINHNKIYVLYNNTRTINATINYNTMQSFHDVRMNHSLVSTGYYPKDIPNPMFEQALSGRAGIAASQICDPNNLLSPDSKNIIEGYLNGLPDVQVSVLVIAKMHPDFIGAHPSVQAAAEVFARIVHNSWGVGEASQQNGILLFLAIQDRVVFISAGQGILTTVSKNDLDFIIRDMKPSLKDQHYGTAVERAITALQVVLEGRKSSRNESDSDQNSEYNHMRDFVKTKLPFLLIMLIMIIVSTQEDSKEEQNRNELIQRRFSALPDQIKDLKLDIYAPQYCPICLADYPIDENHLYQDHMNENLHSTDPNSSIMSRNRPVGLDCGHVFCYDCITKDIKSTECNCPICGEPYMSSMKEVDKKRVANDDGNALEDEGEDENKGKFDMIRTSASSDFRVTPNRFKSHQDFRQWVDDDINFRVSRMHEQSPDVVNKETKEQIRKVLMLRDEQGVEDLNKIVTQREQEINRHMADERRRQDAQQSGSFGSSKSHGGGSSSGGSGGTW